MTQPAIVVLGSAKDGKAYFVAKCNAEAVAMGYHMGKFAKEFAEMLGMGGGGSATFGRGGSKREPI